ncbi:MAG: PAS domain-containing protein [Deltaproteobacteria bacterium]|nr:PAS domain-containing protein [Deltaproteobacteria bacterium]MDQ3300188.1 PAS domain-containing sensor histidine kinase [Myxococcota bacterium]
MSTTSDTTHPNPDDQGAHLREQLEELADPIGLLEGIFAHSPVPYIVFDADGHALVCNQAYREMFGRAPPDDYNLFRDEPGDRFGLAGAVTRAFADETVHTPTAWYDPRDLEHVHVLDARRVAFSCTFFPLRGARGDVTHVAIAFKDVTTELTAREAVEAERDRLAAVVEDKERLATALRATEESLREADRRKDEFLATLAHELRNPLAPIRTGVELIRIAPTSEVAAKACAVIERQLQHMVRLIGDLLDIARVSRGKFELQRERIDIATIVEHAREASAPVIDAAGHVLDIERLDEPLVVHGDLTRLAQVVSNLLDNAAKYTPRGGRITLVATRDGDAAVIRVTDTGPGIPREMLDKVFDLFTQLGRGPDRSQGGLGIGLSLVKKLVEMHGGTVWAESGEPGEGSTFSIKLPLLDDD